MKIHIQCIYNKILMEKCQCRGGGSD